MELISASYTVSAGTEGAHRAEALSFRGNAGDLIYYRGDREECALHFQTLCGFRKPDAGTVEVDGKDLYPLFPEKASDLRCRNIGSIPENCGFTPGLSMLDQITIPLRLAGLDSETIRSRIQKLSSLLSMSTLNQKPAHCSPDKQAIAAIIRAAAAAPKLIVVDRLFERFAPDEAVSLWKLLLEARPKDSVILCLGSNPPAETIHWTKVLQSGTGSLCLS